MDNESTSIESNEWDEGVDLNALPPPPWTPLALGELFYRLAHVCGAGDLRQHGEVSLSPRTFARGRMRRQMRMRGLVEAPATIRVIQDGREVERAMTEQERNNWYEINFPNIQDREQMMSDIADLRAETDRLDAVIQATLPPISGIRRHLGAPPLRAASVTKRTRQY